MQKQYKKNSSKNLWKLILLLFITILIVPIFFTFILARTFIKEETCSKRANAIVGSEWTKPTPVTSEDLATIPYLDTALSENNTVYLGVKELLLCERDFKYFHFF